MLTEEVSSILNEHNDEEGIASVIIKSLLTYYSVNTFTDNDFKGNYPGYLHMIFRKWHFTFINEDRLLSYRDDIERTVLHVIYNDISQSVHADEVVMAYGCENTELSKMLTYLFDEKALLPILSAV